MQYVEITNHLHFEIMDITNVFESEIQLQSSLNDFIM